MKFYSECYTGTSFGRIDEFGEVTTLTNNTSIQISSSISIVCATDSNTSAIEWSHSMGSSNTATNITTLAEFSTETGFSVLTIKPGEQGYYSCDIDGNSSYVLLVLGQSSSISKYRI